MTDLKIINLSDGQSSSKKAKIENLSINFRDIFSMSRVTNWQLAKRRSGSANTKDMSEISGSTKKPYKQKGTGNARQGSKRSVQFVGGRTCHGPKSRSFEHSLPKKIIRSAIINSIKDKINNKKLIIAKEFDKVDIKTAKLAKILKSNSLDSVLIVCDSFSKSLLKASSNLSKVNVINYSFINVYDIIRHNFLILDEKVFDTKFLDSLKNDK